MNIPVQCLFNATNIYVECLFNAIILKQLRMNVLPILYILNFYLIDTFTKVDADLFLGRWRSVLIQAVVQTGRQSCGTVDTALSVLVVVYFLLRYQDSH